MFRALSLEYGSLIIRLSSTRSVGFRVLSLSFAVVVGICVKTIGPRVGPDSLF